MAVPINSGFGYTLSIFWLVVFAGSVTAAFWSSFALFMVFGSLACIIVTIPMLLKGYDVISPWSFVILTVYVGCGVRAWFVAFQIDGSRTIDSLFLLGRPPEFFFWPSVLFVTALALMTIAFMTPAPPAETTAERAYPNFGSASTIVIVSLALIGGAAFLLFAERTGGLSLSSLSDKRTNIESLNLRGYESQGVLRALNTASSYAYWIACAQAAITGRKHFFSRSLLVLNALALPFYASNRSDVAYILIIGFAISLCLAPRPTHRLKALLTPIATGIVIVAILSSITVLRPGYESTATTGSGSVSEAVGGTLVYNRNFTDIPTTAQIIRAVPNDLQPAWGATYYSWLAAPIPRSLWPEKPLVSSGPIVGTKVFGTTTSGVPPGFIGEAYWNFGLAGVGIGSLLFGFFLRRLYGKARPYLTSPLAVVLYCGAFMRVGGDAMTGGVGYALFQAIATGIPLAAALWLATHGDALSRRSSSSI